MSKFFVLGKTLEFQEEIDHWMELYKERLIVDPKMCAKYLEAYDKAGSMEKVLGEYKQVCTNLLNEVIDILHKKLVDFEVYDISRSVYAQHYAGEAIEDINTMYDIVKSDFDILYKEKQYQDRLSSGDPNKQSFTEAIQLNKAIKEYYTQKYKYDDLLLGLRAAIATLYHLFTKCINENYRPYYSYYGDAHNSDKAEALFESAKSIADEDKKIELLLASLKESPKENPAYEYIIETYGDAENEVERMALHFCPEWKEGQKKDALMDAFLCELDYTSEKALLDSLDLVKERSLYFGMAAEKYMQPIKMIADRYDRISKTCDGYFYDNPDMLAVALEEMNCFAEKTEKLDGNDEGLLIAVKKEIDDTFKMNAKEKYSNFLKNALNDYDERYRTVKKEIYTTREEADKVKEEFEKLENLRTNTDFSNPESIQQSMDELDKNQWTVAENKIYRRLFEESYTLCSEAKQLQEGDLNGSRAVQTDIALKLLLISEKYRGMKIFNSDFDEFKTVFMDGFKTIMDKHCIDILSANEEYYKRLSHAQSYAANVVNKSTEKKGIFSKIAGGAKELLSKGYEAEYMFFSDGGKREVPSDTKDIGKGLEFTIKEEQKRIFATYEEYAAKYTEIGYRWNFEAKYISGRRILADKEFVTKEFVREAMKTVTDFKSPKLLPNITDMDAIKENLSVKYSKHALMQIMLKNEKCLLERLMQNGKSIDFVVGDRIRLISKDGKQSIFDSELEVYEVESTSSILDSRKIFVHCNDEQKAIFENMNKEYVWVVTQN